MKIIPDVKNDYITWKTPLSELGDNIRNVLDGAPLNGRAPLSITFGSAGPGMGKSFMVQSINQRLPKLLAFEADVLFVAAVVMTTAGAVEDAQPDTTLGDWVNGNGDVWDLGYDEQVKVCQSIYGDFSNFDLMVYATYTKPRLYCHVLPDYASYVRRLKTRTQEIIRISDEKMADHIRRTHRPLEFSHFVKMHHERLKSNSTLFPVIVLPTYDETSVSLWLSLIVNHFYSVDEDKLVKDITEMYKGGK
jgi:hypothetical protein